MKKNNNYGLMLIAVSTIILFTLLGIYLVQTDKLTINNNNTTTPQSKPNTTTFDQEKQIEELTPILTKIKPGLSTITILTSIDKYNAGGEYITKKNKDLFTDIKTKQLFVMEQIIANTKNYSNFLILNSNGEVDNENNDPTIEGSIAYYPYELFLTEYNNYFDEKFIKEEREVSSYNNSYDSDSNYIYYNNRRAGLNGLTITNISIDKITEEYQATITLNYSPRLSEMLKTSTEQAIISYTYNNNNIKLKSYTITED